MRRNGVQADEMVAAGINLPAMLWGNRQSVACGALRQPARFLNRAFTARGALLTDDRTPVLHQSAAQVADRFVA